MLRSDQRHIVQVPRLHNVDYYCPVQAVASLIVTGEADG